MSLKSWKKEFYQTPARKINADDKIAQIEHSLLKWQGLSAENLARHDVCISDHGNLIDGIDKSFGIDSSTCALCAASRRCVVCPIYTATDKTCNQAGGPFAVWFVDNDSKPMVKVLKKTLKFYKRLEFYKKPLKNCC